MEADVLAIGRHLKKRRAECGWSLDRVAQASGVSKAMLGQIERGESTPTISTLWKIASGLRVPLTGFLVAQTPELQRPTSTPQRHHDASGMIVTPLFTFDPTLGFEMFVIELPQGTVSESAPHAPGVVEHLVVLEGVMELRLDEEWQTLAAGDAIRFPGDQPHAYRNLSRASVRVHDLIHYSSSQ
ncbi:MULTISPECIES: helix-turn-helix domain-containing protein [Salinicola]|uniref:XRE family transcriptional regulator n=1 Tax=Salinicola socius TaxID=404433 RepID=A0A1Q8SVW8_9GAMM|nr:MULTISPECIES: helix-turn-helix domain-containing protein [Salinicola]OLO05598.1 XRE family transcriptional regulator [Salinicola socius]